MSLERKEYFLNNLKIEIYIYIDESGNPWFKAKEVARALEYERTLVAIQKHVDECDKIEWNKVVMNHDHLATPVNWQPRTIFINESGLYSLILRSKKPEAKKFKQWVTSEVLPSIRKNGAYVSPHINQNQLSELLELLKKKEEQIIKSFEQIEKKDKQIEIKDEQIFKLMNKIVDDRPRLAIMPENDATKHELRIYKNKNHHKFVRTQKRNISQAIKRIPRGYELVLRKERIPNGVNVLNRTKELLPRNEFNARYNQLETNVDVKKLIENNILPPSYDEICKK